VPHRLTPAVRTTLEALAEELDDDPRPAITAALKNGTTS
jgi:molecular chaperone DnaJ